MITQQAVSCEPSILKSLVNCGKRFQYRVYKVVNTVASTLIVGANPMRVAIVFTTPELIDAMLQMGEIGSFTEFMLIGPSNPNVTLSIDNHGTLCQQAFYTPPLALATYVVATELSFVGD